MEDTLASRERPPNAVRHHGHARHHRGRRQVTPIGYGHDSSYENATPRQVELFQASSPQSTASDIRVRKNIKGRQMHAAIHVCMKMNGFKDFIRLLRTT